MGPILGGKKNLMHLFAKLRASQISSKKHSGLVWVGNSYNDLNLDERVVGHNSQKLTAKAPAKIPGVGPPLSWCYNPSGFFALTGRVSCLD